MDQLTQNASTEAQAVEAQGDQLLELPLDAFRAIAGGGSGSGIVTYLL